MRRIRLGATTAASTTGSWTAGHSTTVATGSGCRLRRRRIGHLPGLFVVDQVVAGRISRRRDLHTQLVTETLELATLLHQRGVLGLQLGLPALLGLDVVHQLAAQLVELGGLPVDVA